ncbi:fibroblast growth factor-binding protein 2 [Discoglossus pictus]
MKLCIIILALAILFAFALAQNEEKVPFQTKNKDACMLTASGHGEINVKIECKNQGKTYSCYFVGKPSYCRAYNKNPKGFWKQLGQDLQEKSNACDSSIIKHSMCPRAPSQSQLKKTNPSGNTNPQSDTNKPQKKPPSTQKPTTKRTTTKKPATTKRKPDDLNPEAVKIAQARCWPYFQVFCSYIAEIFVS